MAERVKLIVDSTADLPREWLARWDIAALAVYINFGEDSFLDDGVALPRAEFYRSTGGWPLLACSQPHPRPLRARRNI
jgi:fatty acid-binding protein DegV